MIHSDRSVSRFLTRVSKKVPDYYRLQQKISRLSPVLSVVGSIIYVFIKSFFLLRFKRKMLFLTRNNRQKKKTYPKRYVLRLHLIKLSALFATLVASISGCLHYDTGRLHSAIAVALSPTISGCLHENYINGKMNYSLSPTISGCLLTM